MRRLAVLGLTLAVLASVAAVSIGGLTGAVTATDSPHTAVDQGPTPGTDISIHLRANGNARWQIQTRLRVVGENETEAFRTLADRFENGNASVGWDIEMFRQLAREAGNETNRSMAIDDVQRNASMVRIGTNETGSVVRTGQLTLTFTWMEFARAEQSRLFLGDVFWLQEGRWFSELEQNQTLRIHAPAKYAIQSSGVAPRNATLTWSGPQRFEADALNATFTGPDAPQNPSESVPVNLLIGLFIAGLVVAIVWFNRGRVLEKQWWPNPDTDGEKAAETPTAEESKGQTSPAPEEATPEYERVDPELLSDEERILQLLEEAGGRMKQAKIVEETGWSNAKVSQTLSEMAETGTIEKLRIGRENLISLPEDEESQ